jgi:outer membrane protein TolC
MHSASALVGVAIAARLPNVTLSANGGSTSYTLAQSFASGTGFYTLSAGVTQPIFDGFMLYNKQKAAEAGLDQADAQYRATVITAFQNVADALRALQADARAMTAAVRAETAAKASLDIVQTQLNAGQVNQLAVLNAQQTYLTASVSRVQAEANRLSDTAALFMALGGGWPASCTTPVWRECAMGETPPAPVDVAANQH